MSASVPASVTVSVSVPAPLSLCRLSAAFLLSVCCLLSLCLLSLCCLSAVCAVCLCCLSVLCVLQVPLNRGVSSSASVEVAAMKAAAHVFGLAMAGERLATACQWVENQVLFCSALLGAVL